MNNKTSRVRAFANAALKSMQMLREQNRLDGNYVSLYSFCLLFRITNDSIITDNKYGWAIPGKQIWPENINHPCGALMCGHTNHVVLPIELIVKNMCSYPNDSECCPLTFIELQSYEVNASEGEMQKYFPLVQGNKWEYIFYNKDSVPYSNFVKYRDCYEVDVVTDEFVYIANSGYVYTD